MTTEEAEELKRLKRENAELRRANEILKAAAIFFGAELDRPGETVIRFIAEHKDHQVTDPATGGVGLVWGVEPMCAVLSEHGVKISPSTDYEWINKKPTKRELCDEEVTQLILQVRERNKLNRRLGSRKMWIKLRGVGHDVARCTVERLYRKNGWGARYGSRRKTTRPNEAHDRRPDLVDRDFAPVAPNRLWGSGHLRAHLDRDGLRGVRDRRLRPADHRLAAARSTTTDLVLDALEHAFFTRGQEGIRDLTGLVSHSDAVSQYTSVGVHHAADRGRR